MHLRCVFASVNLVNLLIYCLIISLIEQTVYSRDKEFIPQFDNFSFDTDLDKSDEDLASEPQNSEDWIRETTSSITFRQVEPELATADHEVNHVINSGVIENLETEELERISKKYNSDDQNKDEENHRNHDWSESSKMLHRLLELYRLKSSGIFAKRGEGPQLSIVNPLDVLRQRLLLELARRRMKENQDQIQANAEILKKIGKRSVESVENNEAIPHQSVRHSPKDLIRSFVNNRYLDESRNYQSINRSINKCQKCRRKKSFGKVLTTGSNWPFNTN